MTIHDKQQIALTDVLRLLACVVIVLAGVHLAAPVIVPLLLALFLAIVLEPLIGLMTRLGLPRLAGVALLSGGLLIALLFTLLNIMDALPELNQMSSQAGGLLSGPLSAGLAPLARAGVTLTPDDVMTYLDPGQLLRMATRTLGRISDILSTVLVVFLMVLFMLIEVPALVAKSQRLLHASSPGMAAMRQGIGFVSHYLAIKTLSSLVSGLIIWGALLLLQVKFAFIWGALACLLNFIPVIGSVLAAIPPVIQAFIFNGAGAGAAVLMVFLALNLLLGCMLEPYIIGRKLDMTTSTVIISLVVWDGLLGMTGVLLAVPLTLSVKLALEQTRGGRKLAFMMGAKR
ncbi:AI-2E family transporter [Sodalis sp. C49]|uniref:AI-2E family transporter n=1 Tax=unclassified Sodalis (in: enterobacteria) TaxID=2636512 RepID=UPI003965C57D